jgi:hypothetical protein
MTHYHTKGIVSIFFFDGQCSLFQQDDNNKLAVADVQEASFLHDYAIPFDKLDLFHHSL